MEKLLIEIGTEELPAVPLLKELPNIKPKWQKVLEKYDLSSAFEFFYTPRRLVLYHKNFSTTQGAKCEEFIGAPKEIAYKDGVLTKAGQSFLAKAQITEAELGFKNIKGKEVLYFSRTKQGDESAKVLPAMIEEWLESLNFGKTMRWGVQDGVKREFIRAVRSLVCILGDKSVNFSLFGVQSEQKSFVHRSISYEKREFKGIDGYFELLKDGCVILNQNERRAKIKADLKGIEADFDVKIAEDNELLEEVVAITEYPKALLGGFESEFLSIAKEVIITSMRDNQRYFAVFKGENLANHFVVVANAVCENYGKIIAGNERVLRARLNDAMFFWQNDLKSGLNTDKLAQITYLEGLGSIWDKVQREIKIAQILCEMLENPHFNDIKMALSLAKADLASAMVYEFASLQGIMGGYYAQSMGFSDDICIAIKEQYLPSSESSPLPSSEFSGIVAMSGKLDSLLGLFSINKIPTGSKDPYALRRAALGVIKIALNLGKKFDLQGLLTRLAPLYKKFDLNALVGFICERLYMLYDANPSFINAVLASQSKDLRHIDRAVKALIKLSESVNFNENFATFKRLANIAAVDISGDFNEIFDKIDESLFEEKEEKALFSAFKKINLNAEPAELLTALFGLKNEIDDFFERVMINVENKGLKNNRQALVCSIYKAFLSVADIKELSL